MEEEREKFVIFAHSGTYDRLHQVATLSLTAAAMGKEVYIFLFFWALKKFVRGGLDTMTFPPEYGPWGLRVASLMEEKKIPTVREMLADAKSMGRVKIIVCSTGMEYMEVERDEMDELVDEVWGLPTVLNTLKGAHTQLFI